MKKFEKHCPRLLQAAGGAARADEVTHASSLIADCGTAADPRDCPTMRVVWVEICSHNLIFLFEIYRIILNKKEPKLCLFHPVSTVSQNQS